MKLMQIKPTIPILDPAAESVCYNDKAYTNAERTMYRFAAAQLALAEANFSLPSNRIMDVCMHIGHQRILLRALRKFICFS